MIVVPAKYYWPFSIAARSCSLEVRGQEQPAHMQNSRCSSKVAHQGPHLYAEGRNPCCNFFFPAFSPRKSLTVRDFATKHSFS